MQNRLPKEMVLFSGGNQELRVLRLPVIASGCCSMLAHTHGLIKSDPHYCHHAKNRHHKRFPSRASLARSERIFVAANDRKRVASDLYWTTQWVLVQRPGGQTAPGAEPAAEQTQQQRAGLSRCRA